MPTAVVTGVSGFVGKALAQELITQGWQVRGIARSPANAIGVAGLEHHVVDLCGPQVELAPIFFGADVVFHVAAKVGMWGRYSDFWAMNVEGTRRVINAAQLAKVKTLIYTSSPSVIADGQNLRGVDESYPYPKHHDAYYPLTKAVAEREVLAANSDSLFTAALRPHLIWGPGDTNLVPTILNRAASGKLMVVGDGQNLVDLTYIKDCVAAHICAARSLVTNPAARGRAYFISQGDPVKLWPWINKILEIHGQPPLQRAISPGVAMALATCFEALARLLPFLIKEPRLTRFLVSEMATDHYFDISAAKNLLGYQPRFTVASALQDSVEQPSDPTRDVVG